VRRILSFKQIVSIIDQKEGKFSRKSRIISIKKQNANKRFVADDNIEPSARISRMEHLRHASPQKVVCFDKLREATFTLFH
jgi:hypothetical protein